MSEKELGKMQTAKHLVWFQACHCGRHLTKAMAKAWKTTAVGFESLTPWDPHGTKILKFVREVISDVGSKFNEPAFQEILTSHMRDKVLDRAVKDGDFMFFCAASAVTLWAKSANGR
jgi:hypothetical protein